MSFVFSLIGWLLLATVVYFVITALLIVWNLLNLRFQNKGPFETEHWFDNAITRSIESAFGWPGSILLSISIFSSSITAKICKRMTKFLGLKSFIYRRLQRTRWYSDFDDIIQDEM